MAAHYLDCKTSLHLGCYQLKGLRYVGSRRGMSAYDQAQWNQASYIRSFSFNLRDDLSSADILVGKNSSLAYSS